MEIISEKILEKKLSSEVKKLGGLSIKLISTYLIGLPDRICLFPGGRLAFIELKTTKQKPRKIQIKVHKLLLSLDFDVRVIDTLEGINKLISDYERR
jgi:hypothetical protein